MCSSNLCFNKSFGGFWCTLKFENGCSGKTIISILWQSFHECVRVCVCVYAGFTKLLEYKSSHCNTNPKSNLSCLEPHLALQWVQTPSEFSNIKNLGIITVDLIDVSICALGKPLHGTSVTSLYWFVPGLGWISSPTYLSAGLSSFPVWCPCETQIVPCPDIPLEFPMDPQS